MGIILTALAATLHVVCAQQISNGKVTVAALHEGGKVTGFTVQPARGEAVAVRLGSARNIWAQKATVRRTKEGQQLVLAPLVSSPTPRLGDGSQVMITLVPDDPYPVVAFALRLLSFSRSVWERQFGTVPFHFMVLSLPGAEIFYQRGWQIPTPIIDPYPMQGKQTGYGKQIRSEWDDNWTYAPPLGAHPLPDVGLWVPSKRLFFCYDFHHARLTDHTEKDIATAYVWRLGQRREFICLVWPYAGGYRTELRYPEDLPVTIASHFHFLWSTDAPSDRDPNLIVQEFVWSRYSSLLPEVPRVNDLSWLPDAYRPGGYGPMQVGTYFGRISEDRARWWKPGTLVFGGLGWDRSAVDYAYGGRMARSLENVRRNIEFMAPRVKWMEIGGERCCAWQQCLEGEAIDMFDGGVPTVHNIQTWQMALLFLDAYRNDPAAYGKYLNIVDGVLRWTKHVLFTRNGYADVPAAQFCWGAAPSTVFCLRYYYTFRDDKDAQRRKLAEQAYRLARNMMYHYLPTWLADNDEMDDLDAFSYCEPNSGVSWLGAACSNEVWCVPFAATVTYLATGDPWLAHYVNGCVEHWHELFRDEWYPTVRQYGNAFTEVYALYPGRNHPGSRVAFGGLWGQLEQIAWPVAEATVRITCGEKAALAWNRVAGEPTVRVQRGQLVRVREPDPRRVGRHTGIDQYRYYGNGQFSFRLVRYGVGQPEPFTIDVTFPMFDLRGKPVLLRRGGRTRALRKGAEYEEMPKRWDTVVIRGLRYGDVVGVGKIDESAPVLDCPIARARGPQPQMPQPAGFQIADLRAHANRRLSFDWEDPASWAGLECGRRWIFGVPFDLIDADLNGGRVGVRDASVPVRLGGRHLFLLVGEGRPDAKLTVTVGGKPMKLDLSRAVPVLKGWPPCFEWHVDMVEAPLPAPVERIEARGITLFAATSYTAPRRDKLAEILHALKAKQQAIAMENQTVRRLAKLAPLFERMSGKLAILPPAAKRNPRSTAVARLLHRAGLIKHVHFLTPGELVDAEFFNANRFWIAIYAGGEQFLETVRGKGDGARAIKRFLAGGGTLLVVPSGPFPFYYNEQGRPVVRAGEFGLPICGSGTHGRRDRIPGVEAAGWEKAPRDRKLTFYVNPDQDVIRSLPDRFPFPLTSAERKVDERWRPIVNTVGDTGRYLPLITLKDEKGTNYGDAAAVIEYVRGPLAPGRVVYVWATLLRQPEYQSKLVGDIFRWVLENTPQPPAEGLCYFTSKKITVDGRLDEEAWREVPAFQLQQVIRTDTPSPNQPTQVKVRWDRTNLYVAFICEDSDIWATMKQRDQHLWEEEVVEVFVDYDGDGRNYKEFEVNPLNNVVDLNIPQPRHGDLAAALAWNSPGWKTKVVADGTVGKRTDRDRGWVCEMAIPLKDLAPADALPPRPGARWRVNFYRIDRPDPSEPKKDVRFSAWSAVSKGYHEPNRFGMLVFAADPYTDDFSLHVPDEVPGPPWVAGGGQWQVTARGLVGRDGGTDGWIPAGLRGGLSSWTDYRLIVRFDVQSVGSDWRDGPWFGVRCRGDEGYFVEFTDRDVQVHKSCAGRSTSDEVMVARWPYKLSRGSHVLVVEVKGQADPTIRVLVDGRLIGVATDRNVLGTGPVTAGGIVLCPRRWSNSSGHTVILYRMVGVMPSP